MDEQRNSRAVLAVIAWLYPIATAYRDFDDPHMEIMSSTPLDTVLRPVDGQGIRG
jgi:hypothetical protein